MEIYKKKFSDDEKLGDEGERILKPIIEKMFNTEFYFTEKKHYFDFIDIDDKIYIELKTRRIKHNQYPTLYFSYAKKKFIDRNPYYDYYIFFKCLDGIFYFKYDEYKIFTSYGGRKDRGKDEYKKVCNVYTKYLIKV
tara:strand:- start:5670 stop:6080 length:411 start_codon:yes stop_codon:yes gene_type:complete